MKTHSLFFLFFLFFFCCQIVSFIVVAQVVDIKVHDCILKDSREARRKLEESLYKVIKYWNYELPPDCPFNPDADMVRGIEDQKIRIRTNKFKCRECSKFFSIEDLIDNHILTTHSSLIPANGTVCLADFCDMLTCPSRVTTNCISSLMESRRLHCNVVINKCFPLGNDTIAHTLSDIFTRQFCNHLTCTKKKEDHKLQQHTNTWSTWNSVYIAIGLLLSIVLLVFYIAIFLWKRELRVNEDLRRLQSARHASKLNIFKKQKVKGF